MKRIGQLTHRFVEFIPDVIEEGILYVSMQYATAIHRCCCGCGSEVVTPLSPTDWTLIFDGRGITLDPSIGNWSFPCQSHYWILRGTVRWSGRWSRSRIEAGRRSDRDAKQKYFKSDTPLGPVISESESKLRKLLRGLKTRSRSKTKTTGER